MTSYGNYKQTFDIFTEAQAAVILDISSRCASKPVLPSLHVRFKSPNALWRLFCFVHK